MEAIYFADTYSNVSKWAAKCIYCLKTLENNEGMLVHVADNLVLTCGGLLLTFGWYLHPLLQTRLAF